MKVSAFRAAPGKNRQTNNVFIEHTYSQDGPDNRGRFLHLKWGLSNPPLTKALVLAYLLFDLGVGPE